MPAAGVICTKVIHAERARFGNNRAISGSAAGLNQIAGQGGGGGRSSGWKNLWLELRGGNAVKLRRKEDMHSSPESATQKKVAQYPVRTGLDGGRGDACIACAETQGLILTVVA